MKGYNGYISVQKIRMRPSAVVRFGSTQSWSGAKLCWYSGRCSQAAWLTTSLGAFFTSTSDSTRSELSRLGTIGPSAVVPRMSFAQQGTSSLGEPRLLRSALPNSEVVLSRRGDPAACSALWVARCGEPAPLRSAGSAIRLA